MNWLKICALIQKDIVFHNALYDLGWLRAEEVEVKVKLGTQ